MVSFICNACGQTVRKTQVEKHYQNDCRSCDALSCIDCGKDFHGDEYVAHTSCITEAEKYQGKLYKPKEKQNKGEHKQQEWLKQVREATSNTADPRLTVLLERISEYSNIPRKKAKFQNFCKNSVNVRDISTLDKLWEIFSESTKQSPQDDQASSNGVGSHEESDNKVDGRDGDSKKHQKGEEDNELDSSSDDEQKSKDKKNKKTKDSKKHKKGKKLKDIAAHESERKLKGKKSKKDMNGNTDKLDGLEGNKKQRKRRRNDDEEERDLPHQSKVLKVEIEETAQGNNDQFNWKTTIKTVLRQAPDQELPIKRLRKKVLAEFEARGANNKNLTDNELRALFEQKVTKNPKFKVHKDRVKLIK
ncbi:hypothetical protein OS493_019788 [Desmophyllum pertusum]|uniref:Cell growth-regulating nucleolar protein n=1 Tax=Desmophyllum pertusum TaxID=174260 RepID=A0A9X0CS99_9CNID|nr:hypothetical protein OS493_019788 [Desmophyllum pertusum]